MDSLLNPPPPNNTERTFWCISCKATDTKALAIESPPVELGTVAFVNTDQTQVRQVVLQCWWDCNLAVCWNSSSLSCRRRSCLAAFVAMRALTRLSVQLCR